MIKPLFAVMKTVVVLSLISFCLNIFPSVFCSEDSETKNRLKKKLQEIGEFPRLRPVLFDFTLTQQDPSEEFKSLIVGTLAEVDNLLGYIKSSPSRAFKQSNENVSKRSVHDLSRFFLGLRFLQSTLQRAIQDFFQKYETLKIHLPRIF